MQLTLRQSRSVPLQCGVWALALGAIAACASGPQTTETTPGGDTVEPLSLAGDDGNDQEVANEPLAAEEMAKQFEQDLADLEALQSGRTSRNASANRPFPNVPHESSASKPQVVFNQPDRTASTPQAPASPGETGATSTNEQLSTESDSGDETLDRVEEQISSDAPPEVRLREAMVALRRELYHSASYDNEPLRQYIAMAALTMVDPDRALNPDAFPDLRDEEKELLRAYQNFFISLGKELQESGDEAKVIALLDQLRNNLVETPQLKIARAELCTRVDGFGSFQTFDKYAFLAGDAQPVVIYTEIEEFTSILNDENLWVTDLWQELIIYNSHDNVPVWHQSWKAAPDKSANKRDDFFISYIVTLPERLTVGQYTLKVRVRDEATGVIAEAGVPFRIVADPTLAATLPR